MCLWCVVGQMRGTRPNQPLPQRIHPRYTQGILVRYTHGAPSEVIRRLGWVKGFGSRLQVAALV